MYIYIYIEGSENCLLGFVLLDLVLNDYEFLNEVVHCGVHDLVGRHECLEVVRVEHVHICGEVVLGLNELQLGLKSCVLLCESPKLLFLSLVDLLGLINV